MQRVRHLIDQNCPAITKADWKKQRDHGWRWIINLDNGMPEKARRIVLDHQERYGKLNVTIGHSFDSDMMWPDPRVNSFGLYIRDVEDLVRDLYRGMAEFGGE